MKIQHTKTGAQVEVGAFAENINFTGWMQDGVYYPVQCWEPVEEGGDDE